MTWGPADRHVPLQLVVEHEVVGHCHPVGLHRVAGAEVEIAHVGVEEISHLVLAARHGQFWKSEIKIKLGLQ